MQICKSYKHLSANESESQTFTFAFVTEILYTLSFTELSDNDVIDCTGRISSGVSGLCEPMGKSSQEKG